MIHAVGINMEKNNQENNKLFFGRLEGSRITKRGFGCGLAIKAKKGEKKVQAGRFGLRPGLPAYENYFSLFFFFSCPVVCRLCTSKR